MCLALFLLGAVISWKCCGVKNTAMLAFKAAAYRYLAFHGPILDKWGDCVVWTEMHGRYAYLGVATDLVILDTRSGPAMKQLSRIRVGGVIHGISYYKGRLYMAAGDAGLVVIDIEDPRRPQKIVSFPTMGYSFGVTRHNDMVFVADRAAGIRIFDVSQPNRPRLLGNCDKFKKANAVHVKGNIAFVADGDKGIAALNVSNPASPQFIANVAIDQPPREFEPIDPPPLAIAIKDSFLYAAMGEAGLAVIDISNPGNMRICAVLAIPGSAVDLRISGNLLYLAQREGGLAVVNIEIPESPEIVRTLNKDKTTTSISLSGGTLVAGVAGRGANLYSLTDPRNPELMAHYRPRASIRAVAASPELLVAAAGSAGLAVYSISSPAQPRLASLLPLPDQALDVYLKDTTAFVAMGHSGIAVIDLTHPESPILLCTRKTPEYALSITGTKNYIVTAEGVTGYSIFDVTNPEIPVFVKAGHADEHSGYAFLVQSLNQGLLVANYTGGAELLNVERPGRITAIASKGPRRILGAAAFDDDRMILMDYYGSIFTTTVQPGRTMKSKRSFRLPGYLSALTAHGSIALVFSYDGGVWLIDASEPGKPKKLNHIRMQYALLGGVVQGRHVYAAAGEKGIAVFKMDAPSNLEYVNTLSAP